MATTANYGWTTPDDTDLVKDGASAIRTLGSAIDTTTKANADLVGLVHIETQTLSAVSGVSFNDVFSANYGVYKLVISGAFSNAAAYMDIRLRASGVDNSSANYDIVSSVARITNALGSFATAGATSFNAFVWSGTSKNGALGDVTISNPFLSTETFVSSISAGISATVWSGITNIGVTTVTTSYDGLSLLVNPSGTFTGKASIFGYKD